MENTTLGPDRRRRNAAISTGSVVTGIPSSLVWATASSSLWFTVSSEQTGSASNGTLAWVLQTCIVCFSSDSDGSSTSVRSASSFSLMNNDVRVLPVPHAMMSCPRSDFVKHFTTSRIASR